MGVAWLLSKRSTCERGQVGAVIVKDDRIISTGYNGAPPGMPHCIDVGCDMEDGCQRAIHAEANAIAFAARNGVSVHEASVYCTHSPCIACAQLMLSAGIVAYYYVREYRLRTGLELLDKGNLIVKRLGADD